MTKTALTSLGALGLLGALALNPIPAAAGVTAWCGDSWGSFTVDSCVGKHDGKHDMWTLEVVEYATGPTPYKLEINVQYDAQGGPMPEGIVMAVDKWIKNDTSVPWGGMDIGVWNLVDVHLMMEPAMVDMMGYFTPTMYNHDEKPTMAWMSGTLMPGENSALWMAVYVPLNWDGVGHFYLEQFPKIPEPTTIALLGFGLAGLAGLRRQRART